MWLLHAVVAAAVALTASTGHASSAITFSNTLGSHMVLQREPARAVVWGFGPAGSPFTLAVSTGDTYDVTVASDGQWRVSLQAMAAGGPYTLKAGDAVLEDVLFGDVWVCGGQSNMQFSTSQMFNASEEIAAAANYPRIRLFTPALKEAATPQTQLLGINQPWSVASPATVGVGNWSEFSAVCWVFARATYDREQVPLGMVASNWGGTPVEAWSSPEALAECGAVQPAATATASGSVATEARTLGGPHNNSVLWNAMIVPLLNTPVKGAIWYQGEADCAESTASHYACRFPAMIADWRRRWHEASNTSTFPFGFVQLSTWQDSKNNTEPDADPYVPIVRWGQTANYGYVPNPKMPGVFMCTAIDLGDPGSPWTDIHPRYKKPVGERLALAGAAVAYGHTDLYWTGPLFHSAAAMASSASGRVTVEVVFRAAGAEGITVQHQDVGFEVQAGENGTWVLADAQQLNSTAVAVTATLPAGTAAAGVRYEWRQAPCAPEAGPYGCTVYAKKERLPAPPFTAAL